MRSFAFIFCSLFVLSAYAKTEVILNFKMSPMGDFIAQSAAVKGFAKLTSSGVTSEGISVPVSSLDAGMELRTKHMKEKYLEAAKYPDVKLIKAEGSNGKGTGIIEIHGVQKPISGDYKIDGGELEANFTVKLSEFNIAKVKYLGVGVNDEVKVKVRVPVKK